MAIVQSYNRRNHRAGRAAILAATLNMNCNPRYFGQGVKPDSVPHHDATPNHQRHLDAVLAEARAKRERKGNK